MLPFVTAVLLIGWVRVEGETWHLVDISSVVCPLPVNLSSTAPAFNYEVAIDKTSDIQDDTPYIVSFFRKSPLAMTITYKVEDSAGVTVIPTSTVNLQALSNTVPSNCQCTGVQVPTSVASTYGPGYGSSCSNWDQDRCGTLWPAASLGPWCCRNWCYASADCPDAYGSQVMDGQYFSYSACASTAAPTTCTFTRPDPCACDTTARNRFSSAMRVKFPDDYGLTCRPTSSSSATRTWDYDTCATNYEPSQLDTWCCQNWCYVNSTCPSAKRSINAGTTNLWWSSNACDDDTALVATCPFKPQVNQTNATQAVSAAALCACVSTPMGADILRWTLDNGTTEYADPNYGTSCAPWDQDMCDLAYRNANHGMWCCESWCWVGEQCPTAQRSNIWPGHYFSYSACAPDADAISSCRYDPDACACVQADSSLISRLPGSKNVAVYGASCQAHDNQSCRATWENVPAAAWGNASTDHSWCCDYWCYVPERCPIGLRSWISNAADTSGEIHRRRAPVPAAFYSYQTCDDLGDSEYNYVSDQCVAPAPPPAGQEPTHRRRAPRRLRGPEGEDGEDEDSTDHFGPGRQLAGRRRSSRSSRSRRGGGSYPRRRASSRRRSPPSPRRRARRRGPTAPSTPAARRRGAAPQPRRRAAPRRRRVPAPSPLNSRRRTTAIAPARRRGSPPSPPTPPFTSDRRRVPGGVPTPAHRRRATYGYTSRPQMMNNYNGQMPQATSYGYSGYNAYPAQQKTNVAMYALGGAVAGAVVGAGAMYAYNQAYGNGWEIHRRRRQLNSGRIAWCTVLSPGIYQGDMMDCYQCRSLYGAAQCPSADGCWNSVGCSYTTASNYNRDDIEVDAIIPSYYTWPLKVKFQNITGGGINTNYVSGNLCPPSTAADFAFARNNFSKKTVFKSDLFLVLTAQSVLVAAADPSGASDGTNTFAFNVFGYIALGVASLFSSLPY